MDVIHFNFQILSMGMASILGRLTYTSYQRQFVLDVSILIIYLFVNGPTKMYSFAAVFWYAKSYRKTTWLSHTYNILPWLLVTGSKDMDRLDIDWGASFRACMQVV